MNDSSFTTRKNLQLEALKAQYNKACEENDWTEAVNLLTYMQQSIKTVIAYIEENGCEDDECVQDELEVMRSKVVELDDIIKNTEAKATKKTKSHFWFKK